MVFSKNNYQLCEIKKTAMNTTYNIKKEMALQGFETPFTLEEVNARIAEAKRQIAAGLTIDSDVMFRELEEEFEREDELDLAMAV